jgi:hypothetical protein
LGRFPGAAQPPPPLARDLVGLGGPTGPLPFSCPPPPALGPSGGPAAPPPLPSRAPRAAVTPPPPLPLRAPPVSPSSNPLSLSPPLYPPARSPPSPTSRRSPARPRLARRRRPSPARGEPRLGVLALGGAAMAARLSGAVGPGLARPRRPPSSSRPRPGPGLARGFGAAAQPARPRNLTPAWRDLARGFGAVARCACPARRGGVARLSAARRSLAPALPAVAAWLACPRLGAALRPPCPPWRRGSPARDLGAARPWRLELGRGARRVPGILQARPGCWRAAMAPPRLRCGAQLRPARFARVARPRRRGVACPLASQLACGSPHDLLVVASFTRSCAQQWSAASFARSRSLFARATLKHHA